MRAARRTPAPGEPDAVFVLYHRYEQGDLTAQEFSRLRRTADVPAADPAPPIRRRPVRAAESS